MNNQQVIQKLKNEHQQILVIFSMANKGYGFSDDKWKETLIKAKRLFEQHLDYEDETIYNDEFFGDADFNHYPETARRFQEEMKDITVEVEKFFKKYAVTTNWPDFSRDYANLVNLLKKRIKAEEAVLFDTFEKSATPPAKA